MIQIWLATSLYTFDFEITLKEWIKLDMLGYLATIKFRRHILSLVDYDLVGYLATFDFENTPKEWIKLDLLGYHQISMTYTEFS